MLKVQPPPLPTSARSPGLDSFARQAANACLAAPLLLIGLEQCVSVLARETHAPSLRPLALGLGWVAVALALLGFVAGLVALVSARPGQRGAVYIRAGAGLGLLGLLGAIAVPNFVRARSAALQNQAALQEVQTAANELRARAVASFNGGDKRPVDGGQLQQSLNRAATRASGDTAAMLKASAAYAQKLQALKTAYERASQELVSAKVLATRNLAGPEQLQARRAVVRKFLAANEALKTHIQQSEANYRKELAGFQLPAEESESAVRAFRKAYGLQGPLLLEIREADERIGNATLAVLNLLEANWGRWSYDETAGVLRFDDSSVIGQYKDLMAQIRQAAAEQRAVQQRLAAVMSRTSSAL